MGRTPLSSTLELDVMSRGCMEGGGGSQQFCTETTAGNSRKENRFKV